MGPGVLVKNNHFRIICNTFQEILLKSKETASIETNKGSE